MCERRKQMNNKKMKVLSITAIALLIVLISITSVLLIKVINLEESSRVIVNTEVDSVAMDEYLDKYFDEYIQDKYVEVSKEVDPDWEKWEDVRYYYGFDKNVQPVFNTVNGVLESDTMISVRGGKGRWNHKFASGGHVFEGWSGNELSRLTLIMGKFHETFACIQTYSPAGLYEEERRFGWIKLGSDEKKKGVDISQGWTNFYTPLTLQSRSQAPKAVKDSDLNPQLSSDKVPVGTIYYDTTLEKVRVMTIDGWKSFVVE